MDDLEFTEKTPRAFAEDDDIPIHVGPPQRRPDLPRLSTSRAARGTRTSIVPPPIPTGTRRAATLPPPIPMTTRRAATVKPPLFATTTSSPAKLVSFLPPADPPGLVPGSYPVVEPAPAPEPAPVPPSPVVVAETATTPAIGDDERHVTAPPVIDWDPTPENDAPPFEETGSLLYAPTRSPRNVAAITGIAVAVMFGGVLLWIGLRGHPNHPAPAPPPSAIAAPVVPAPAPAHASAVAPAPDPAVAAEPTPAPTLAETGDVAETPKVTLADLPITSEPAGAVITLISDGEATVLGPTPVTAAVDPAHSYDVVVALRDHPTTVTHVDPSKTHELAIDLRAPAPVPAPRRRSAHAPVAHAPVATAPMATPDARPAATGTGILMVSSKPPCEIAVDGKATRLVTPQRSISLSAGVHTITLTNAQQKVKKTLSVKITANKPTKLIQDFTH